MVWLVCQQFIYISQSFYLEVLSSKEKPDFNSFSSCKARR